MSVGSDYVLRGVTQSDHLPSAEAGAHLAAANGLFAGLWAATVKEGSGRPLSAELAGYVGYRHAVGESWNADAVLSHYAYAGYAPRRGYDYDEASIDLNYRDRATLTVTASPDSAVESRYGDTSGRAAFAYELVLRQPLPKAFSAQAGVGYRDIRRLAGTGYLYWSAGLGYDYRAWRVDLSWIGTDRTARELFGHDATQRLIAGLSWHF